MDTTDKVYPTGEQAGLVVEFTSPTGHTNHVDLPLHKSAGYSLNIAPAPGDSRVYKYEFAEWWAIDANGNLVRKGNWNYALDWSASEIHQQLGMNRDQYLVAVYARSMRTALDYEINYDFVPRTGGDPVTYTVSGSLNEDQLNEKNTAA